MKFKFIPMIYFFIVLFTVQLVSSAHYIIGVVNDAKDGTLANGRSVVLWDPANGINDNLTDAIGPTGNSGVNNLYMIDCELLNTSCNKGDTVKIMVLNNGDNYIALNVSLTTSGGGYDLSPNITLNSPPNITSIQVDDSITSPPNYIDLNIASNQTVICNAIVNEYDGNNLQNASAIFYDSINSNYNLPDNNNSHYSNSSCYINLSYGNQFQRQVLCTFYVQYYAFSSNWTCTLKIADNLSFYSNRSAKTFINPLLGIGVDSPVDFGQVLPSAVTPEKIINITNYGNVDLNISLSGYGSTEGDSIGMVCSIDNISVEYVKYNLTSSNPGDLNLDRFENLYTNLTNSSIVKSFNLGYRKQSSYNEAVNSTYWRVYAPEAIQGSCSGNILIGASQNPGS